MNRYQNSNQTEHRFWKLFKFNFSRFSILQLFQRNDSNHLTNILVLLQKLLLLSTGSLIISLYIGIGYVLIIKKGVTLSWKLIQKTNLYSKECASGLPYQFRRAALNMRTFFFHIDNLVGINYNRTVEKVRIARTIMPCNAKHITKF